MKKIKAGGFCLLVLLFLFLGLTSAKRKSCKQGGWHPVPALTSVHIIDRNGISEAITSKDRLEQFLNVDFLTPQPYQKVLRIYSRDYSGNLKAMINSYHENGNPKQWVEIVNGRAFGRYQEWHANGVMSIFAKVIGGDADITIGAQKNWLFDEISYVWDEEGRLIAELPYCQGSLEGVAIEYHPNGQIWKRTPYSKNKLDGVAEIYKSNGELLQQTSYIQGLKHGRTLRFWNCNQIASQEEYCRDRLESGIYFSKSGEFISEVKEGTGLRATFAKDSLYELQEYQHGILEGSVRVFNAQGKLLSVHSLKDGVKHGEEVSYYENSPKDAPQPYLAIQWHEGIIQGVVRSWYPSGIQQSQREMARNIKNGFSTAWYQDGNLMMIEEYEDNKLVRGDYFRKGERIAVSQVVAGNGIVTLFDENGNFVKKCNYYRGKPEL